MARMTLREAAERTSRSITTLRRYIRSGRLAAEKRDGRFGPEYFIAEEELERAGLPTAALVPHRDGRTELERAPRGSRYDRDTIPLGLYQELQYKHEQLLVQYGMMRAGGLQAVELRAELEERRQEAEASAARAAGADNERMLEMRSLRKALHEARLEVEGRGLEIAALEEKVRALELMTRNAATNETIDDQFRRVIDQKQRVQKIVARPSWIIRAPGKPRDH